MLSLQHVSKSPNKRPDQAQRKLDQGTFSIKIQFQERVFRKILIFLILVSNNLDCGVVSNAEVKSIIEDAVLT